MTVDEREMVERRLKGMNLEAVRWDDEDDRPRAWLGPWECLTDDEDRGLYEGAQGELYAVPVGAEQYGNLRIAFYFIEEGCDSGSEVEPFNDGEFTG